MDDMGDGGGKTKAFGKIPACDDEATAFRPNVGAGKRETTSVSNAGTTLDGDLGDNDNDRLVTRNLLPEPNPPFPPAAAICLFGEPLLALTGGFLRGDLCLRTSRACGSYSDKGAAVDDPAWGVGGRSSSIICTCQARFSSNNLTRSAFT